MAQKDTADLVAEIDELYMALRKTTSSVADIARSINSILLHDGVTKDELNQGWDKWVVKRGGKQSES